MAVKNALFAGDECFYFEYIKTRGQRIDTFVSLSAFCSLPQEVM
jgi:hypothetical protein